MPVRRCKVELTGVTVTNNGEPGGIPNIRIRGYGTTNNNDLLYIIDGVQTTDAYVLNTINPLTFFK